MSRIKGCLIVSAMFWILTGGRLASADSGSASDVPNAAGLQTQVLFDAATSIRLLNDEQFVVFERVAKMQSNHWADSILEGDYRTSGETQLDRVELLTIADGAQPRGYRITYSEKAWFTGDCDPRAGLAGCEEGTISEATYVSVSGTDWTRDERALADYTSK